MRGRQEVKRHVMSDLQEMGIVRRKAAVGVLLQSWGGDLVISFLNVSMHISEFLIYCRL